MSKNILFIFNFGSEIRQFYYSDVINDLVRKKYNVYISLRVNNDKTQALFDENITIVNYYNFGLPFYYNLIKEVLDSTENNSNSWNYLQNSKKFKSILNKYIYLLLFILLKLFVKIPFLKRLLVQFHIKQFETMKFPIWKKLLQENKIDKIIVNVPNFNISLLASAKQLNIPVEVIFHTNKDIFTLGKIFFPYANVAVWNKKMKEEFLLINSNFKEEQLSIVGCSHFSYLAEKSSITDKYFLEKFALEKNDKTLLYIAAAPFVIEGEYEFVRLIEKSLKELHIKDYKIIIKTNPMDSRGYWDEFKSKNIEIYKSDWAWNEKEAFNYPTLNELKLFNKVLEKVDLCIGLPSTVSIEAAIKETPNLNICFDYKNVKSIYKKIVDMWNAPFYKNARENGAIPVFNEKELREELELCLLKGKSISENQEKYIESEITYDVNQLKTRTSEFIRKKI